MQLPDDFDPAIGVAEVMEPGLRRIVAPNPSPMTYRGTNTYLVGETALAVVDPGPESSAHLEAILLAICPEQSVSHIIVTHSHLDHSPLAGPLSEATGAPVLAFGDATAGRSAIMQRLADAGLSGGGEGIDAGFAPDHHVADGDIIAATGWQLEVLHTPGHLGNHISLGFGNACLTADHVMGWASSLVSPPDGDLTDFMASCARLMQRDWRVFYPGHGAPITDPRARLTWLVEHRQGREAAIVAALNSGPATAAEIAGKVYTDTPPALLPAAARNVLAHLIDLMGKSLVKPLDPLGGEARFVRI
ncbi:MBL fold metallo-hydrolase [Tateyamaria omphalii]|uniref:MBL fold metallo-hydrolase n=1 Tax=Tateyamaria omphalii TaxID=299262 RepID=UPI001C991B97|nr:MBL fold metallo-hydrolase [Tateyamaria omphalii]MBY5932678.1 MBL fold metallo-hydrolase [Tateyamaria omphalii]